MEISFIIKWILIIASFALFYFLRPRSPTNLHKPGKAINQDNQSLKKSTEDSSHQRKTPDDGFDFLREKGQLKSKGDKILNK